MREIIEKICTPPVLAEKDQFLIKFAETQDEIERTQRLRYEVFKLEQGKGLGAAAAFGIDRDEFDDYCQHLIVVEKDTGLIVGTYRMHPGAVASKGIGFYSSREYQIEGLENIADDSIEVGRSCVSPAYRNGAVVSLLWAGIAEVMKRTGFNYLLGCVSLETVEPAVGWALHEHFLKKGLGCTVLSAKPQPDFVLPSAERHEVDTLLNEKKSALLREIPPLFKGYLRIGITICGEPALDKEFGSIDFLILFSIRDISQKYARHFLSDN